MSSSSKALLVVVAALLSTGCHTQRPQTVSSASSPAVEEPVAVPLELIRATRQRWVGGIPGAGSGVEFKFVFQVNVDGIVFKRVDQLEVSAVPEVSNVNSPTSGPYTPAKGDQVQLYTSVHSGEPGVDADQAVVVYELGGNERSFTVERIEELPPQMRP